MSNTDKPEYLYNAEFCPCPRGQKANCPNYRNCGACIANHRANPRNPFTACERKAKEENPDLEFRIS